MEIIEENKNSSSLKDYWLNELSGDWEKCSFRYDTKHFSDKQESSGEMAVLQETIDNELQMQIMKLAGESATKLFMILAAGLTALLHRWTGSNDIIIGSPIYKQDIEGNFINTILPLRSRLQPKITFKELLLQVRQAVIEGSKNQNYPLDVLLYELGMPVSEKDFPLFDVAILVENIHDLKYLKHICPDVIFYFRKEADRLEMILHYRSDLYREQSISHIGKYYKFLLSQAITHVELPLVELPLMTEADKAEILYAFNNCKEINPATTKITDPTIDHLFSAKVHQTPDRLSVVFKGNRTHQVTYDFLDRLVEAFSRQLRQRGVQADAIVGLLLEPSIEMVVGILGILRAGGAYLPIDPGYPQERINYMLKDSNVKLLIVNKPQSTHGGHAPFVLNLEHLNLLSLTAIPLCGAYHSNQPAYIIYTSGSTGIPKGVLIEHRNILNYILWRQEAYSQTHQDIALQLLSIAFDGFCANFYPTLLSGGKLVMVSSEKLKDIDYLIRVITGEKITNISMTPSYYQPILEKAGEKTLKSLTFIVLGGERAGLSLLESHYQKAPGVTLINEYGPTENSVTTTVYRGITANNFQLVGKPIANNYVFILGGNGDLLPVGIPGELCVAGAGLSRGYLNQPELTAEKFNRDFQPSPLIHHHLKLYRTGDLARWLSDGNIEFMGRKDKQVKIRGYRVELGEVENCIHNYSSVKDVVVDVAWKGSGTPKLCAWVVPVNEQWSVAGLREFLYKNLPDYMIPSHIVQLTQIPLTPSGKVDRNVLEKIAAKFSDDENRVEPRTETEKKLLETWKSVLGTQNFGVTNSFFTIGGDSIKILSLLYAINKEFKSNFKVESLYENETIEKFAQFLEKKPEPLLADESETVIDEMEELKKKFFDKAQQSGGMIG